MTHKMTHTKNCINCGANTNSNEKCINCGHEIANKSLKEGGKSSLALATIEQSEIDSEAQKKRLTDAGTWFERSFRLSVVLEFITLKNIKEHFVENWTSPVWVSILIFFLVLFLIAPKVINQRNTSWLNTILGTLIIAKIFGIYTVVVHLDSVQVLFSYWLFWIAQIFWVHSILCFLGILHELDTSNTRVK